MHSTVSYPRIRKMIYAMLLPVCLFLVGPNAAGAEVPWSQSRFQYVAHKKDLRELLREFSLSQGVTVDIGEGVQGRVTGNFDLTPQETLDLLAANHGFAWYFDGSLLYITASEQTHGDSIRLRTGTIDQLEATLARLAASERRYSQAADGPDAGLTMLPAKAAASGAPDASRPAPRWDINRTDRTLNAAVARWSAAAGWQMVWELPLDYEIEAGTSITGTFEEAVEIVAKSFETAEIPMKVIFYKGNKVLRIVAKGAQ